MMRSKKSNNIYSQLTLFLIGCLYSLSLFANDPAVELMNQGQNAMDSKNYREAIRLFSEVYNLPVATDGQKRQADSEIAYCRTQIRNAELPQKIQNAENLFSAHKYDDCIYYCTNMLAIYRSNSKFRNLITRCNDSITAENNRQMLIEADNLRQQRLSRFQTDFDKSYRYYSTLQYNDAKNIYDSIMNEYPEFKDSIPSWTFRCDSIVDALKKYEAVDWKLIDALNKIKESGSISRIGNLNDGFFVVQLNTGHIYLLKPSGDCTFIQDTHLLWPLNDSFDSGILGPCIQVKAKKSALSQKYFLYSESDDTWYIETNGLKTMQGICKKMNERGIIMQPYKRGFAKVRKKSKYGIVDMSGNFIVPIKYHDLYILQHGFVGINKTGKNIYEISSIDDRGTVCNKFKGKIINEGNILSGLDDVIVITTNDNTLLSLNGGYNINEISKDQSYNRDDIYENAVVSYKFSDDFALISNDTRSNFFLGEPINGYNSRIWYFVNRDGLPLPNSQNNNSYGRFSNGLAPIQRGNEWGIIDRFGNTTFIEDYNKQ